jgi:serine protease Do
MRSIGLIVGLVLSVAPRLVRADELIELKTGQMIRGEVLKEKPDAIYVDIGVTVVAVPRDQIAQRSAADKSKPPGKTSSNGLGTATGSAEGGLFQTADLQPGAIKDLVERFAEGVVLVQTPAGLGSGFFINGDGYLLTNHHVIEKETKITVVVFQKKNNDFVRHHLDKVEIIAVNAFLDLALLRVTKAENVKITPLYLGDGDAVNTGDSVFAIGNPLGLERTVSQGIVSNRSRVVQGLVYLQTTAPINPGNSGGPLLNMRGEVIGVTNMGYLFANNLGFAIPVSYVKEFLKNREAFAFDKTNPNTGHRYLDAPRRRRAEPPPGSPRSGASSPSNESKSESKSSP